MSERPGRRCRAAAATQAHAGWDGTGQGGSVPKGSRGQAPGWQPTGGARAVVVGMHRRGNRVAARHEHEDRRGTTEIGESGRCPIGGTA
jgi:hypothetical protein